MHSLLYNGKIMKRLLFITGITLTLLFMASATFTAQAAMPMQGLVTPTPGPDGRILVTVQEGQNCIQIATLAGIPIAQLRLLNNLDENCVLQVGQKVLIGIGGPSGIPATSGPLPSATPGQVTPTPGVAGEASVCVLLFDDLNGDSLRQETEVTIPDGAISVIGTSGQYSETATTTSGIDPICFEKVIQGTYNISVAAPEGYNATTQHNYTLEIKAGEQIYVDFGAQVGGQAKPQDATNETGSNNWLGLAGGILVLAGIGLGIYAWMIYGRKPNYEMRKPPYN
jgi:LysM repeat protein